MTMTMRIRAATLAVLLAAGAPCAGAQDGTLLFSSGFEQGTALRPIAQGDCWDSGCFQHLEGTDASTGFSWPPAIWGGGGLLFLLADAPVDAATIGDYFSQRIVTATGRTGSPTSRSSTRTSTATSTPPASTSGSSPPSDAACCS